MQIREVGKNEKGIIDEVVRIHLETFEGFFLTFMGKGFLKTMYSSYCAHGESGLLIAVDEKGKTVGFLAYSGNMSGLYEYMIKKKLIPFAWYSLGAFFRKPKVFMRLVRAFLKPSESQRDESYVELASIGVDPSAKSKGIGSQLIDKLKDIVDFAKNAYITLETDAENNEGANRFYQKNGFTLIREYATREGRKMNEYRFAPKSETVADDTKTEATV